MRRLHSITLAPIAIGREGTAIDRIVEVCGQALPAV